MSPETREPVVETPSRERIEAKTIEGSAQAWADPRVRRWLYPLGTVLAVGIVLIGQLAEDAGDSQPMQMFESGTFLPRWSVVLLVLYALAMWGLLDRTVRRSLPQIRHVVNVDDETFAAHEQRMRKPQLLVDLAILAFFVLVNLALFLGLNSDLLLDDPRTGLSTKLPADAIAASVIILGYVVIGWAFVRLIVFGVRLVRQLWQVSREPLEIDVFDTSDLVPFGNIALAVTLAPAGALIILLVGLGAPTTPIGWSVVIEATVVIVLALLLPLRGFHRQMSAAKDAALSSINERLRELYEIARGPLPSDPSEATRIGGTAGALVPLRKTVQEMTTWPFRDTVALGRAVLIASAPLIYTTLAEVIRVFVIGPLSP